MNKIMWELTKAIITSSWFWLIVIVGIISYIINMMIDRKRAKESYKCPKCGGILIERNGKYGTFIGCSNFPRCRFTLRK